METYCKIVTGLSRNSTGTAFETETRSECGAIIIHQWKSANIQTCASGHNSLIDPNYSVKEKISNV